jgi:hypothetical protein
MAKLRKLKAEVKSLCEHVQDECYVELIFGTTNEIEMIWGIMVQCEKLKANTLSKINSKAPNKMTYKDRKQYYKAIEDEFYSRTMSFIQDLNTIIP